MVWSKLRLKSKSKTLESSQTTKPVFLRDVLTPSQKRVLLLLVAFWFFYTASFFTWWFQSHHVVTWPGMLLNSLLLGYQLILPGYFFFFIIRMKRVDPRISIPSDWKVAMVVTKAPSEPWEVVKATLLAMLAQSYPHDTWLADEDPRPETILWCQTHSVSISCRKGIEDYHRPTWPRRTRCKEGNLAYFYDTIGYQAYDFVVQLDADHVPANGYLEAMLRPFVNPAVGYVAAPSICDANAQTSWSARGRLYAEATMHGALQAGYNSGWAPLCIGSHYAVRTAALKQIGGLGPELAEDHSTTLMMNADGWQGIFALDAEAHGDGPASFPDCMTQEFQWSRSLTKVLLETTPRHWKGLRPHLKFQFLFAQLWYPLFGFQGFAGVLLPIIALAIDHSWVRVNYGLFMAYLSVFILTTLLPVILIKQYRCLRPRDSKLLSWETILFQIARGPWILFGVSHGLLSSLLRKELPFKVTPKGAAGTMPLPIRVIAPYFFLGVGSALAVIALDQVRQTQGYYFLTLINAAFYIGLFVSVLWLHLQENCSFERQYMLQKSMVLMGVSTFVVACLLRLPTGVKAVAPDLHLILSQVTSTLERPVNLSTVLNQSYPALGVYDPAGDFAQTSQIKIDHHFVTWRLDNADELVAALSEAKQKNRFPMITLEPWPWEWNGMTRASLLSDISAGKYDGTIERIMEVLKKESPQKVLFRFAHEMEIVNQYPWSKADAEGYVAAYRHVVDLARQRQVKNLLLVWSPAGFPNAREYWPGEDYVDYIGLSIYATPEWNGGIAPSGQNLSFEQLMSAKYWFAQEYRKPLIVAEAGVNGTPQQKQEWLANIINVLPSFPKVKAFIYFNQVQPDIVPLEIGQPDWSLSDEQIITLINSWKHDN